LHVRLARGKALRNAGPRVKTIEELNKKYAAKVLEMCGDNKSKAAEVLGISRASLWRRLKKE